MVIEIDGFPIPTWPVFAVLLLVLALLMWRRKHSLSYLACFVLFGLYLLLALHLAFFPIRIDQGFARGPMLESLMWSINLIPLKFDFSFLQQVVIQQIILNMLLTVPFGFGTSFLAPLKAKDFLWLAPAVGIGIEAVQLIISLFLRYFYRIIDVNDGLLNALGVLIGYGLFRLFARLYLRLTGRFAMTQNGLKTGVPHKTPR